MVEECVLDFSGIDVLAPRNDHLLYAVVDVEIAILIEIGRVARAKPAIDDRARRRFFVIPIAFGDHWTADHNLAHFAHGTRYVRRIEHLNLHALERTPAGEEFVATFRMIG